MRRRIDRRVGAIADWALLAGSWRSYVERRPGRSLLTAAGLGMVLSAFLSRRQSGGRFGSWLLSLVTGTAWPDIWHKLKAGCCPAERDAAEDTQCEEEDDA